MTNKGGLFVVIDGPSGIGKTTVSTLLHSELVTRGVPAVLTTEPSPSRLGELARYGTKEYRGLSLACLVTADRYHHLETVVRPALRAGSVVVCDRYVPSSLVLQQLDGVDLDFVSVLNQYADVPDLTVIFTGDPKRSRQRAEQRGTYSRFHGGHQAAVREDRLYRQVAGELETDGWPMLHHELGDEAPEAVAELLLAALPEELRR
jgi:dTMP kinase